MPSLTLLVSELSFLPVLNYIPCPIVKPTGMEYARSCGFDEDSIDGHCQPF